MCDIQDFLWFLYHFVTTIFPSSSNIFNSFCLSFCICRYFHWCSSYPYSFNNKSKFSVIYQDFIRALPKTKLVDGVPYRYSQEWVPHKFVEGNVPQNLRSQIRGLQEDLVRVGLWIDDMHAGNFRIDDCGEILAIDGELYTDGEVFLKNLLVRLVDGRQVKGMESVLDCPRKPSIEEFTDLLIRYAEEYRTKVILFDLPNTLLGSNKKIFFFNKKAAKQNGNVIYPPVLITIFILLLDQNTLNFSTETPIYIRLFNTSPRWITSCFWRARETTKASLK